MKTASLKIICLFLLLLTVFPLVTVFIFQTRQKKIQHRMKEQLEEKMLHTVRVPAGSVRWVKPGKEIWLGDKMFDIKSSLLENGDYIFTGLYDEEETLLVKQMQTNQQEEKRTGNKLLAQLFQLLQTPCDSQPLEATPELVDILSQNDNKKYDLSSSFLDIITPPPQVC
ncbi:MAG: hypothetical protein JNM19_03605 [Chitinophagaceae bacterium]|nr:hypothetical protein [Chitinophagaceae bacterium]